jgi:hypothetical protein
VITPASPKRSNRCWPGSPPRGKNSSPQSHQDTKKYLKNFEASYLGG